MALGGCRFSDSVGLTYAALGVASTVVTGAAALCSQQTLDLCSLKDLLRLSASCHPVNPAASVLGRKLCCAPRAILQLMWLEPVAHHRLLWISEELIFSILAVIHT